MQHSCMLLLFYLPESRVENHFHAFVRHQPVDLISLCFSDSLHKYSHYFWAIAHDKEFFVGKDALGTQEQKPEEL